MKRNKITKLALDKHTVRVFDNDRLAKVIGGGNQQSGIRCGLICDALSRGLSCWGPCA